MSRSWKSAFTQSVLIHLLIFGTLIFLGWLETRQKKPETVLFELVPDAAPQVNNQVRELEAEPEMSELERLEVSQIPESKPVPVVPDIPEPEPEPAPTPQPTPQRTPEPQPEPKPEPEKKVSYEEWARTRNLPDRVQRVEEPRRQTPQVNQIQTNIGDRLSKVISPIRISGVNVESPPNMDELQAYLSRLRNAIQSVFQPPQNNLSAETRFLVTASGAITQAQVIRSSGNAAFDQAAIQALSRVRPIGPPPGNQAYTFELTFRGD